MADSEIHKGDIGTVFEVEILEKGVTLDISLATVKEIKFRKPDRSSVTMTGVFVTDGTDGLIQYTTVADDLDQTDDWEIQGFVRDAVGEWHSEKGEFKVYGNI